jgi:penicillin-binding protein 2
MVFFFKKNNEKFIKRQKREIEIEEILVDKISYLKEDSPKEKLEVKLSKKTFILVLLFGISLFIFLWSICFSYQIKEGQKYYNLAENNKYKKFQFASERGIIYDRNLKPLVKNETSFDLWYLNLTSNRDNNDEKTLEELSRFLGLDIKKIIKDNQNQSEILIKKNLSHEELIFLQTRIDEFSNFQIRKNILRNYENLTSLSHILGYIGQGENIYDYIGKEGVEKTYDSLLKEKKGVINIERDATGREIKREIVSLPENGKDLVLSIDFNLQKVAQEALEKNLQKENVKAGAIVILNPKTGEILSLVSMPSFDNNLFSIKKDPKELEKINNDPLKPQLNRAIAGLYPSGSAIKPFIASAALEENIISEDQKIYCPQELCIKNTLGKKECFEDWTFHGWTDIKRAIAESVNTFFYIIAGGYRVSEYSDPLTKNFKGLGIEKIKSYLEKFNFGQKTNVDLPGEQIGRIPDPDWKKNYFKNKLNQNWFLGDTYNLSIGQGYFLTTPLQLAVATASLVNGGKIIQPHVAKGVLNNNQIEEFNFSILRENIISGKTLRIIKEGMLQTVQSPAGSAHFLSDLPVKIGAKTGTAQVSVKNEILDNWITIFAPYEDPEIVLVVLAENVKGLKPSLTQKVAKEILTYIYGSHTQEIQENGNQKLQENQNF